MALIDDDTRKWWVLAATAGVLGLVLFDQTTVGVALPTIRKNLHLSQVASHWVINAYLLLFAVGAAAGGKLSGIFGHRTTFMTGLAIFGAGACGSGFAQSGATMLTARALQGVGAAIVFPTSVAMLESMFPPDRRNIVFGIQMATGGMFMAIGPAIGGFFTEVLTWRWIFWINVPILALIGLIASAAWIEPKRASGSRSIVAFDFRGLFAWVASLGALVFATVQMSAWGWASTILRGVFFIGIVSFVSFLRIESRRSNPLLQLELFRNATFAAANLVAFAGQYATISIVIFVPLYLQQVLGLAPLAAGFTLLYAVLPWPLFAILAGRLADRIGARRLAIFGLATNIAGISWLAVVTQTHSRSLPIAALFLCGCTLPFLYRPSRDAAVGSVKADQKNPATDIHLSVQLLGATMGMTVAGACLALAGNFATVYGTTVLILLTTLVVSLFALHPAEPDKPARTS